MTISKFITKLRDLSIEISLVDERLICNAPKGSLTAEITQEIKKRKPELVVFFKEVKTAQFFSDMPITALDNGENKPLSLQQRRLWYFDKLEKATIDQNLPDRRRIRGPLDVALLEQCISRIFQRHEILRTRIIDKDTHAVQEVEPDYQFTLPVTDFRSLEIQKREKAYVDHMYGIINTGFDLASLPLIRIHLYVLDDEEHILFFMPHHIVWDGWSFDVFDNELNLLYTAGITGNQPVLPELTVQYGDFAAWRASWLQSGIAEEHLTFWRSKLGGTLPILEFATDYPRPAVLTHNNAAAVFFKLDRKLTDTLTDIIRDSGATLFMILLVAYKILLHRITVDQRDIIVGVPISGRNYEEINNLLGFFVNTLVVRSEIDPECSILKFLKQVRDTCVEAFNYQDTPFEKIVEVLNPVRDMSRTPIFQTLFAYQDVRNRKKNIAGLPYEPIDVTHPGVQTDLVHWVRLSDEGITGAFDYNCDLFKQETVERMVHFYVEIINRIVENPTATIKELCAIPQNEYEQQIRTWNATQMEYPKNCCVHELFRLQAATSGDKTALIFENDRCSYRDLDRRSDLLARLLISRGMKSGDLAGIYMERCIDMVVAMLGILKAGGGYVPLDPDYPTDRLKYMITDSGIKIILSQSNLKPPVENSAITIIALDTPWDKDAAKEPPLPVPSHCDVITENIAYMIYTSGSTGKPKGVKVPHRALVNFLVSMQKEPGITPDDSLLAVTTLSFDIAELELHLPLISGATVVITSRDTAMDSHALMQLLEKQHITIMQATPSTWRILIAAGWEGNKNLKILCGGEAFPKDLARTLIDKCGELWNMYGPTETTVWSTCYRITDKDAPILIGRPIGNTQVFVLDADKRPVPIGVPGELYIGGDGVTLGYHNRPDLTEKAFISSPFTQEFPRPLIYKTGDLCRFHADGNLEYFQRIDNQVKVRGHRIELGEIENQANSHQALKQSVAAVIKSGDDVRIALYFTLNTEKTVTSGELREHLRATLPRYMVPQYYTKMEALPLTPNGKVDRKRLPAPDVNTRENEDIIRPPSSEMEKLLVEIWMKVLKMQDINIDDDFFALGGHSLLAVQMVSIIFEKTGINLPLAEFMRSPTIEALSAVLDVNKSQSSRKINSSTVTPSSVARNSWSFLVPITSTGTRVPFYCVHGVGGNVMNYKHMEKFLGADQPLYGLQCRGLDGISRPFSSIETMAQAYVDEIRQVQPHGPYILGGGSMGGLVAYEMAQLMVDEGEQVEKLIMFDTICVKHIQKTLSHFSPTASGIKKRDMIWKVQHGICCRFRDTMKYAACYSYRLKGVPIPHELRYWLIEQINLNISAKYNPKPYLGLITFFRATLNSSGIDPYRGWVDFAKGGMQFFDFPCKHEATIEHEGVLKMLNEVLAGKK